MFPEFLDSERRRIGFDLEEGLGFRFRKFGIGKVEGGLVVRGGRHSIRVGRHKRS